VWIVSSKMQTQGVGVALLTIASSGLSAQDRQPVANSGAEPPNSIRYDEETALVSFEHKRHRITECKLSKPAPELCSAISVEVPSEATVVLTPLPDGRAIRHKDPRKAERLDLGGSKPYRALLRLGRGPWEVAWPGAPMIARLGVRTGEDFAVSLEATSGECLKQGDRCRLVPDRTTRIIRIPAEHQLP
jgi:hypothetical protein